MSGDPVIVQQSGENNITSSPGNWLTALHWSSIELRENISKFWAKDEGYVQKWHLRYKTSDISETKQSIAKLTTECV